MTGPNQGIVRRVFIALLLGSGLFISVVTAHLWLDGGRYLKEAQSHIDSEDRAMALIKLEDAVKSYFPGSPYPFQAIHQMEIMAKASLMRGNVDEAKQIWETTRRAIISTRHFIQPYSEQLWQANLHIERLRNNNKATEISTSNSMPHDPNPFMSMALFCGLITWIGGAGSLMWMHGQNTAKRKQLYAWAACLGGLSLWLIMSWTVG